MIKPGEEDYLGNLRQFHPRSSPFQYNGQVQPNVRRGNGNRSETAQMQQISGRSGPKGRPTCSSPRLVPATFVALGVVLLPAEAVAQTVAATAEIVGQGTTVAVLFLVGTLVMKVTAIVIGYLIVRLGHDTLIRGVTGDLDFGFTGSGVQAKLKSASPGAAFVLAGAAIIVWALAVEKPFDLQIGPPPAESGASPAARAVELPKGTTLPD